MTEHRKVADGLYRLIKLEEDHNPVFPSRETVVEVREGEIINLSSRHGCALSALGGSRALYGPISTPYDLTPVESLPCVLPGDVTAPTGEATPGTPD